MVSARRGWGTQRANPGALQRKVFVCLCPGDPAPSGPPLGPLMRSGRGENWLARGGGGVVGAPRRRGGGSGNGAPVTEPLVQYQSPRREVVRSSAGVGVLYPPFLGSFT